MLVTAQLNLHNVIYVKDLSILQEFAPQNFKRIPLKMSKMYYQRYTENQKRNFNRTSLDFKPLKKGNTFFSFHTLNDGELDKISDENSEIKIKIENQKEENTMLENENTKLKNELISLQNQLKENEKRFEENIIKIRQDNSVSISILLIKDHKRKINILNLNPKHVCLQISRHFLSHRLCSERNDELDGEEFLLSDIKELKYQLKKASNIPQNHQHSSNHQFRKINYRR